VTVAPGADSIDSAGPDEPAPNTFTNRIECGKEVCDASRQICCGFSADYGCAPRKPEGPGEGPERMQPLINSCQENVQSQYSFDAVFLCDDSTDCPTGQVCCSQWLWSGAGMFACVPASDTGNLVCDFHERCAGDTCRTRDTHCVKKECRRIGVQVTCNGVTCDKDTICCQRSLEKPPSCERTCEPANQDDRVFEFECSKTDHCPPGAFCQAGMLGSYCSKSIDTANAVVLCESDADCAPDGCAWMGKTTPPTCKMGQRERFKSCDCD
jgi:hypothetical protein